MSLFSLFQTNLNYSLKSIGVRQTSLGVSRRGPERCCHKWYEQVTSIPIFPTSRLLSRSPYSPHPHLPHFPTTSPHPSILLLQLRISCRTCQVLPTAWPATTTPTRTPRPPGQHWGSGLTDATYTRNGVAFKRECCKYLFRTSKIKFVTIVKNAIQ